MILTVNEITEVKVVSVDVDKEFIYFDKLPDGSWRMTYTKSLDERFVLHERTPEVRTIDVSGMSHKEIDEIIKLHRKKR
jgi:hypothetical protein